MFCTTCQADRQDNKKFCSECGTKLAKRCTSTNEDGTLCGEVLKDGAKFCPECGCPQTPLTKVTLPGPPVETVKATDSATLQSKQTDKEAECKKEKSSSESAPSEEAIKATDSVKSQLKQTDNGVESKTEHYSSESDSEFMSAEEDNTDEPPSPELLESNVIEPTQTKQPKQVTESERKLEHKREPNFNYEHEERRETKTEDNLGSDHRKDEREPESDYKLQPKTELALEPEKAVLSQKQITKDSVHMSAEEDDTETPPSPGAKLEPNAIEPTQTPEPKHVTESEQKLEHKHDPKAKQEHEEIRKAETEQNIGSDQRKEERKPESDLKLQPETELDVEREIAKLSQKQITKEDASVLTERTTPTSEIILTKETDHDEIRKVKTKETIGSGHREEDREPESEPKLHPKVELVAEHETAGPSQKQITKDIRVFPEKTTTSEIDPTKETEETDQLPENTCIAKKDTELKVMEDRDTQLKDHKEIRKVKTKENIGSGYREEEREPESEPKLHPKAELVAKHEIAGPPQKQKTKEGTEDLAENACAADKDTELKIKEGKDSQSIKSFVEVHESEAACQDNDEQFSENGDDSDKAEGNELNHGDGNMKIEESLKVQSSDEEVAENTTQLAHSEANNRDNMDVTAPADSASKEPASAANRLHFETNIDTLEQISTQRPIQRNMIRVHFHALLTKEFEFVIESDKIDILIELRDKNGQELEVRTQMNVIEVHRDADDIIEVKGYKDLLAAQVFQKKIFYKYRIRRNSRNNTDGQQNYVWGLLRNKTDERIELRIEKSAQDIGYWNQYDGILYEKKKSKGFLKAAQEYVFWSNTNEKQETYEIMARLFGQQIANTWPRDEKPSEIVNLMKNMSIQLTVSTRRLYTDVKINAKINVRLWKAFNDVFNSLNGGQEQDVTRRTCILIVMLYIRQLQGLKTNVKVSRNLSKKFLVQIDVDGKIANEFDILMQYFSKEERNDIRQRLVELTKDLTSNSKDQSWWYIMPAIHFLSGLCKPFDPVSRDADHSSKDPKWWGLNLKELVDAKNSYKYNGSALSMPVETIIRELSEAGYFHADYYLPRTIVASLQLYEITHILQHDTHGIPLEIFFGAIKYYITVRGDNENVIRCLSMLMIRQEQEIGRSDINRSWLEVNISADMSVTACQMNERHQIVELCIRIHLCCLSNYEQAVTKLDEIETEKWDLEWSSTICGILIQWMDRKPSPTSSSFQTYLEAWNNVFYTHHLKRSQISDEWNRWLINALQGRIKTLMNMRMIKGQDILTVYCNKLECFGEPMKTMMTELVSDVLGDPKSVSSTSLSNHDRKQLWKVMLDKFNSQWTSVSSKTLCMELQTILQWENLPLFLAVLWKEDTAEMTNLNHVIRLLDNCADELLSGAITIKDMKVLTNNSKQFLNLLQFSKVKDRRTHIEAAIAIRSQECRVLDQTLRDLSLLEIFCSNLEIVDLAKLKALLKVNVEKTRLCDVISISSDFKSKDLKVSEVKLKTFTVTTDITNVIGCLHQYWESLYFKKLWNEVSSIYTNSQVLMLAEVYKTAVFPVVERLEKMAQDIETGSITFDELEHSIGYLCKNNYENMVTELSVICTGATPVVIDNVVTKLKKYRKMVFLKGVAETVLKIKETYHLDGDFRPIELIKRLELQQYSLSVQIDDKEQLFQSLEDITPERHNCLKAFAVCFDVVTWLRETLEEPKLKELKVFVDLAIMSAGDNIEQSDRAQSLLSAVTGYASLLFDLDTNGGYDNFRLMCNSLWKELENMENLHMKLIHANQHLYWFKDIRRTHGAVEMTSFIQAETVNEAGVYMIGSGARQNEQNIQAHIQIDSDDYKEQVLGLLLPASSDGKREAKHYRYSELKDLQSRLMLVGGESEQVKHCIDRFSTIFDGVIRLCNIYIKLITSGCVLFKDFEIQVYCNPSTERPVCVVLEFKNGKDLTQLKCHKTEESLIESIVPKVAGSMETCLSEWMQFVQNRRNEHEHLNYFTTDQLVILQREMAKVMVDENPSVELFPIIQLIRKQCNLEDIKKANVKAKEEIQLQGAELEGTEETLPKKDKDLSKRTNFIQQLKNAKLTEMIPFALEEFKDSYDVPKAIRWCMKKKITLPQMKAARRQKQIQDGMKETEDEANEEIFYDSDTILCDVMVTKLQSIWQNFLQSASSNLRDYISLKHLGVFLRQLKSEDPDTLQRRFPANFEETAPNLIICPPHEILHATISLYMTDPKQPLPQTDEVLTCSPETKLEEIDVFLQRAIFSSKSKIHCILNADLLNHTVCEGVEQRLNKHTRNKGKSVRFRLVFICSSQNQHRSPIVSSLDGYRKEPIFLDIGRVSTYIAERLKVYEEHAAASVDKRSSTVRVVSSTRSGVGKTLYKKRKEETLQSNMKTTDPLSITLSLHGRNIDVDKIVNKLLPHTRHPAHRNPLVIHVDVANEDHAKHDLDIMLFNLLVLGNLVNSSGYVWRKDPLDLYLIERLESPKSSPEEFCQIFRFLPKVVCRSPKECLECLSGQNTQAFDADDQLFDQRLFESELYQKPYNYLSQLDRGVSSINTKTKSAFASKEQCLKTLLSHCRIVDPSWSELHHFVKFLNIQLNEFENNLFVSDAFARELPGFSTFVLKFLIQMSKDFSSRSLNMSEETEKTNDDESQLRSFQMKRKWESSPHPYIFFNADGMSFTFLGFYIDPKTFDLIDQQTEEALERRIMKKNLYDALIHNKVPIRENFDTLKREDKIERLCRVMDMPKPDVDPDETYELTTDNAKKIMAIYMRFRCDIPVIVMGETGCGKTRLVKFMCDLMLPKKGGSRVENMIIMKVHGGTTDADIKRKVKEAEKIAEENRKKYSTGKNDGTKGKTIYTVLFFDEANTTESVGLIKEILCDKTMDGEPLTLSENLKFVAACNPYRRHTQKLIEKLENAGLGYHVAADETTDRLGRIAMRCLVYRVQRLPPSLLPFVWDFGQLSEYDEVLYIRQMVRRYARQGTLPDDRQMLDVISTILAQSQEYMRKAEDECSFVSLRDVERVLQVLSWFRKLYRRKFMLFPLIDEKLAVISTDQNAFKLDEVTRCLVLALGVCYHASLTNRKEYREHIAKAFREPCKIHPIHGPDQILNEIECCQEVFLDCITSLEENIARNQALKENVFMMVVCIELRIPLFLVGKPGCSKSLAKVVVTDAMQGNASLHPLFAELKQVQMVSFQCSPLATPQGIVSTFKQCAMFQRGKSLDKFVSVAVLDEIGLAEDSPTMPLKTLHPLLEEGCEDEDIPPSDRKVSFIGISNWALDPAKMNRGIFVQRNVPDSGELENTAKGICSSAMRIPELFDQIIKPLAKAYLEVFDLALKSKAKREFFGLRDFYSLMKMVSRHVDKSGKLPSRGRMMFIINRNFSGLEFESEAIDPVSIFIDKIAWTSYTSQGRRSDDPVCTLPKLIQTCLADTMSGSRHMLLLTENYNALETFRQKMVKTPVKLTVIFGSSFRRDQDYTQVCRNISRIKLCMEAGRTVILLNSDKLYESLYDALNQYYVYFGGQRFVDLGLGSHRVKCPVHKNFKLIIVAEKQFVYDKFPIPLINRMEKYILTSNTMLTSFQNDITEDLRKWAEKFAREALSQRSAVPEKDIGKVIVGYHEDACSAIVLHVSELEGEEQEEIEEEDEDNRKSQIIQEAKEMLISCATPDAIVRLNTTAFNDRQMVEDIYWKKQEHDSILDYLESRFKTRKQLFSQITTHGKLLVNSHRVILSETTGIREDRILLLESLTAFDTEQQFNNKIRTHLENANGEEALLVVQCDSGDTNANLIACARYSVLDEYEKYKKHLEKEKADTGNGKQNVQANIHVIFIIQMSTMSSGHFKSIQCGDWHSVHIDNLHSTSITMPSVLDMQGKTVATLMNESVNIIFGGKDVSNREETKTKQGMKKRTAIDFKEIFSMCVHGSMTRVRDTGEAGYRTTERIALLLELLHKDTAYDQMSFLHGLTKQLVRLLDEKEKTAYAPVSANWLAKRAAAPDNIHKAGTLRRACLQTVGMIISPVLSGIVAFLDTNQNLNILKNVDETSWQYLLWLAVLNGDGTITLSCKDIFPEGDQEGLRDFVVLSTGSNGRTFQSRMPFSWLIRKTIDDFLRCKPRFFEKNEDGGDNFDDNTVFERTPIGTAVQKVCGTQMDVVIEGYIHDFVNMVYDYESNEEHTVVCRYLKAKVIEKLPVRRKNLVDVHIAYSDVSDSLKYFRNINHVWPYCSKLLLASGSAENTDETSTLPDTNELTIKALYLMIETISLQTDQEECDLSVPEIKEKWLLDFHRHRNVVQQTLAFYLTEILTRETENAILLKIRSMWNRVVVLQLFLEDVCTTSGEKAITIDFSKAIWGSLTDEDDMKNIETLESMEEFLFLCYNSAQSQYTSKADKCSNCESALHHERTILPCGHTICEQCQQMILSQSKQNQKCFTCKTQLSEGWENNNEFEITEAYDRLKDYRRRCNTFFMDVVSQLCFSENQAPSDEVVDKLMNYSLFGQSSVDTSGIQIGVDPDEAFKAYILKHLIRTKEKELKEQLSRYLSTEDASNLPGDQRSNLLLLVICCIEDNLVESISGEIHLATTSLANSKELLTEDKPLVDRLYGVANARAGLAIVAKYIYQYVQNQGFPTGPHGENVKHIVRRAGHLCKSFWPWKYLMKYIFKLGGSDTLLTVLKSKDNEVTWIHRDDEMQDNTLGGTDMYLCCGEPYVQMRQLVMDVLNDDEIEQFSDKLQEHVSKEYAAVMLELALHREMTISESSKQTRLNEQILRRVAECEAIRNKEFTMNLVTRGSGVLPFNGGEGQELHLTVKCLIFHWFRVFSNVDNTVLPSVLKPLVDLAVEPKHLEGTFFPTMPQDDLAELRGVLKIKTAEYTKSENPSIYVCPNGHPYEVRNCGRPYHMGKCLCGADIGGKRNVLHEGNQADTGEDRTFPGHILGDASERKDVVPERSLTRIYLASVRLILHLSMCGGCFTDRQVIAGFVKPEVKEEDIPAFLFAHVLRDLDDMKTILSSNVDDVFVLLHFLADKILKMGDSERKQCDAEIERLKTEKVLSSDDISWNTKEGRKNWETCFARILLKPIIEDSQKILEQMNAQLQGANSLLRLLGETAEEQSFEASLDNLAEDGKLWKFIAPITLNSLKQVYERQLSSAPSDAKQTFLQAFLDDVSLLQAVRFIPSVFKLQRALFRCYKYRLYRKDATKITIRTLRDDRIADDETDQLLDDTIEAWAIVKKELKGHVLNADNVRIVVPGEIQDIEINDDSPITVLLPTLDGKGICTFAMLDILLRRQNDLLDKYARMYGRDSDVKLPSVQPQHVTSAHLVSFNPQYDIQPLILANCTLHIGDASVEYNFVGFERQLVDRFVSTKTKVSVEPYLKIEQMVYRTDMKDADSLNKLENVVPQIGLDGRKSAQICSDLNTIPDLCQILADLDITISFLNVTSGDPTWPINRYMSETLKMETILLPQKIKTNCQLQHMKSLWMALSLKKSILMVQDEQTSEAVFEIVPALFHKRIPDDQLKEYENYLEGCKDDQLNELLNILFTYIILELTKKVDDDEEAPDITQYPLGACLDELSETDAEWNEIPFAILAEHSANAWIQAVKLISKRTEDKKSRGMTTT